MTPSHVPRLSDLVLLWLQEKTNWEYNITTWGVNNTKRTRLCIDGALVGYIDDEKCEFTPFYIKQSPEDKPVLATDPAFFEKTWAHIETLYDMAARVSNNQVFI